MTLNDSTQTFPIFSGAVQPALLDSGTTNIQLPAPIAQEIYKLTGAVLDSKSPGYAYVPCNLSTAAASLNFGFGGPKGANISVPMSALILAYDGTLQFPDGSPACDIGVEPSNIGLTILGDNFLRSAYVVYNIDAKQIGLAQAKPNAPAGSSIIEIQTDGIPGASRTASLLPFPTQSSSATSAAAGPSTSAASGAAATGSAAATSQVPRGTLTATPGQASFTAQSAAPLEPSVYVEADSMFFSATSSSSSTGSASTASTAPPKGAAASRGASILGVGSAVGVVMVSRALLL